MIKLSLYVVKAIALSNVRI
ncbi:hypothetical protein AA18889_2445 [Acetobacter senegalensis DSM 18889]|nr:hypothetical protein AA18889_2445 [Acetobacter senegalensis DSM 18889]